MAEAVTAAKAVIEVVAKAVVMAALGVQRTFLKRVNANGAPGLVLRVKLLYQLRGVRVEVRVRSRS